MTGDGAAAPEPGPADDAALELTLAPEDLAALVAAGRAEGGVDNITVLVADVVETADGLVGAPADAADTPSHAGASTVLAAAAERAVRGKSSRDMSYLVLLDAAGLHWSAFLSSGTGFTANADGRAIRRLGS